MRALWLTQTSGLLGLLDNLGPGLAQPVVS